MRGIGMKKWLFLFGIFLVLFIGGYFFLAFFSGKFIQPSFEKDFTHQGICHPSALLFLLSIPGRNFCWSLGDDEEGKAGGRSFQRRRKTEGKILSHSDRSDSNPE